MLENALHANPGREGVTPSSVSAAPQLRPARPDLHSFSPGPYPHYGPVSPHCRGPSTYHCLAGMPTYGKRKLKNKDCVTGHFNTKNVGKPLSQTRQQSLNRAHAGSLELNGPSCRCRGNCALQPSPAQPTPTRATPPGLGAAPSWASWFLPVQPLCPWGSAGDRSASSDPSAPSSPHWSPTIVGTEVQPGQN